MRKPDPPHLAALADRVARRGAVRRAGVTGASRTRVEAATRSAQSVRSSGRGRARQEGRASERGGRGRRRPSVRAFARGHEPGRAPAGAEQRQPVRLLQRRLRDEHVRVHHQPSEGDQEGDRGGVRRQSLPLHRLPLDPDRHEDVRLGLDARRTRGTGCSASRTRAARAAPGRRRDSVSGRGARPRRAGLVAGRGARRGARRRRSPSSRAILHASRDRTVRLVHGNTSYGIYKDEFRRRNCFVDIRLIPELHGRRASARADELVVASARPTASCIDLLAAEMKARKLDETTPLGALAVHGAPHRRPHRPQRRLARRQHDAGPQAHRRRHRRAVPVGPVHRARRGRREDHAISCSEPPASSSRTPRPPASSSTPSLQDPTLADRIVLASYVLPLGGAKDVVLAQKVALRDVNAHSIVNATTRFTLRGQARGQGRRRWSSAASRPIRGAPARPRRRWPGKKLTLDACRRAREDPRAGGRRRAGSLGQAHGRGCRTRASPDEYRTAARGVVPLQGDRQRARRARAARCRPT